MFLKSHTHSRIILQMHEHLQNDVPEKRIYLHVAMIKITMLDRCFVCISYALMFNLKTGNVSIIYVILVHVHKMGHITLGNCVRCSERATQQLGTR